MPIIRQSFFEVKISFMALDNIFLKEVFMARIPEEEIDRIKLEVSIVRLVEAHGVVLKRRGADLVGLYPWHEDREPSLIISPKKNLWHCMGACNAGGSVIDWVMRDKNVTFRRAGYPKHMYLPGPHKGVWNIAALAASSEIILCEALIDALTFWCAGYRNVTASYGAKGFTEDHFSAFKRYGTKRVFIAYDRDNAGEEGAASLAKQLMREGIECLRIQFPKGMDANEVALKVQPADKSLGLLMGQCRVVGKRGATPARGGTGCGG